MTGRKQNETLAGSGYFDERGLSIIVHALFSAWMLAFLFEGQILYALIDLYRLASSVMVFGSMAATFSGLLLCGFIIKTRRAARQLFLSSYLFFIVVSAIFFFSPSVLWIAGIIISSFFAGGCVAAWSFYLKSGTPKNERIKTIADMLILSNILMILLNMTAVHLTPHFGLAFSMLMLGGAFFFALKLPVDEEAAAPAVPNASTASTASTASSAPAASGAISSKDNPANIAAPLIFLCLFIVVITINSGLMYHVINPAFTHLKTLTSWYWAVPYIAALFIMRNLPRGTNRAYTLYVAIAMIGFSFIGFLGLDRSVSSYLVVNTLMLGACGVYDLFWWSILGEMLDLHHNPAQILGSGLSANVLGILLGGLVGNTVISVDIHSYRPTLLALAVVCVTLALLPLLHKYLSHLLKDHTYLTAFSGMPAQEQISQFDRVAKFGDLSERESEVASRLLQGKTYRAIAGELYISENTVKYYVKNIYAKFNIRSRAELINIMLGKR